MKSFITIVLVIALISSCAESSEMENYDAGIGVSESLAEWRKEQIGAITYRLSFDLPANDTAPVSARLSLDVEILKEGGPLILDFSPNHELPVKASVSGNEIDILQKDQHLIISADYLEKGSNTLDFEFQAGDLSLNRHPDFMYTLLVPDRARTVYPCFDQPNLKATFELELRAHKDWRVLSATTPELAGNDGDFNTWSFPESDLMSTYLFSFVAGKFQEAQLGESRFLYRETDTSKIRPSLPVIEQMHRSSLEFLEAFTAYEFPFQKLDYVGVPGLQFGGMEHVGAIQYSEGLMLLNEGMPISIQLARAKTIAHEVSHMWFGDLVTMAWFDDVWLKEVFANFMADKICNPNFPEVNHQLNFMQGNLPTAYSVDRTPGSNPIRQELDNLKDAGNLYGTIIYNKAPVMMRQLELILGEDAFRDGLQEYIRTFANSNATWNDLVQLFDARTDADIAAWSDVWVNQPGRPVFSDTIGYSGGHIESFTIRQQAEDGSDRYWPQAFEVSLVYADSVLRRPIEIMGKSNRVTVLEGLPRPLRIDYNSNGIGYGIFPLDPAHVGEIPEIADDVNRGHAYINLYENVLAGNIPVHHALEALLSGFRSEDNEIILQVINGHITSLFWKFMDPEKQMEWQPRIASAYWERLQEDLPPGSKRSIFGSYSGIAYQGEDLDRIYRLWNGTLKVDGLVLLENDKTGLATKMALFGHPESQEILDQAREAISNPDQREQFDFTRPALSRDPGEREQFFESFRDVSMRRKEKWVQAANAILHHPLHQETSIHFLGTSLELLEEIQETGDIFFPADWLHSTIGQYNSAEARQILDAYLDSHPDLNPKLKAKLLQSTDNLNRFQTMVRY